MAPISLRLKSTVITRPHEAPYNLASDFISYYSPPGSICASHTGLLLFIFCLFRFCLVFFSVLFLVLFLEQERYSPVLAPCMDSIQLVYIMNFQIYRKSQKSSTVITCIDTS